MEEKVIRYDYINAVRGIAVILVIVIHVSQITPGLPYALSYLGTKGAYGVQLFFIASAFTIFLSYSRRIKKEGSNTIRNFFIRRFFRITPMYYTAAVFYTVYYYYNPDLLKQQFQLIKVLPGILYINGFFIGAINYIPPGGWSVGVEMAFYCFVPFLFKRVTNLKKALWLFILLFAGAMLVKFAARYLSVNYLHVNYHSLEDWSLYFWFPNQVVIFSLGIILYFTIPSERYKKLPGHFMAAASIIFIVVLFFLKDAYDRSYYIVPEHITTAVLLSLIVFVMSREKIAWLDNRITRFLGEISFSLYLVHFVVVNLVKRFIPVPENPYLYFISTFIIVLCIGSIVSRITYLLIEKRGIAWGEAIIRRSGSKRARVEEKKEQIW